MSTKKELTTRARQDKRIAEFEAKMAKKNAQKIAKAQIKELRPYLKSLRKIDLRKSISAGQKSYITKAWQEYQALTIRPTKIYRTKDKKRLKMVQNASQHIGKVNFDVAFIPTINASATVKVKGDKIIVSSKYVDEIKILFNMRAMAENPEAELQRVLRENPEYDQFVLMAGEYIWNGGISRGRVIDRILPQLMRYTPGGAGYEKRGPNSHYLNWAIGLRGLKAKRQESVEDYLRDYNKAVKAKKATAKNERRKRAMKYGKKF